MGRIEIISQFLGEETWRVAHDLGVEIETTKSWISNCANLGALLQVLDGLRRDDRSRRKSIAMPEVEKMYQQRIDALVGKEIEEMSGKGPMQLLERLSHLAHQFGAREMPVPEILVSAIEKAELSAMACINGIKDAHDVFFLCMSGSPRAALLKASWDKVMLQWLNDSHTLEEYEVYESLLFSPTYSRTDEVRERFYTMHVAKFRSDVEKAKTLEAMLVLNRFTPHHDSNCVAWFTQRWDAMAIARAKKANDLASLREIYRASSPNYARKARPFILKKMAELIGPDPE